MRILITEASPDTRGHLPARRSSSRESVAIRGAYDAAVGFMADATPEIRGSFWRASADFCPVEVTGYYYEYD